MKIISIPKIDKSIPVRDLKPGQPARIVEWGKCHYYIGTIISRQGNDLFAVQSSGLSWDVCSLQENNFRVEPVTLKVKEEPKEEPETISVRSMLEGQYALLTDSSCIGHVVKRDNNDLIDLTGGSQWLDAFGSRQNVPNLSVRILPPGTKFEI